MNKFRAQRSGSEFERRGNEVNEPVSLLSGERYEVCLDEGQA